MTETELIAKLEDNGWADVRTGVDDKIVWVEGWRGQNYRREAITNATPQMLFNCWYNLR